MFAFMVAAAASSTARTPAAALGVSVTSTVSTVAASARRMLSMKGPTAKLPAGKTAAASDMDCMYSQLISEPGG